MRILLRDKVGLRIDTPIFACQYSTSGLDGNTITSNQIDRFYIDHITYDGKSSLFDKHFAQVARLGEAVVTLLVPKVLFCFHTSRSLYFFSMVFLEPLKAFKSQIQFYVRLDFCASIPDKIAFASWTRVLGPHGSDVDVLTNYEEWMVEAAELPPTTHIHLVFPFVWRDFRTLRALSKMTGFCTRNISFDFPENRGFPLLQDREFLEMHTVMAIKNLEIPEQPDMTPAERKRLVEFGCTGFNSSDFWNTSQAPLSPPSSPSPPLPP